MRLMKPFYTRPENKKEWYNRPLELLENKINKTKPSHTPIKVDFNKRTVR